ncbi:hypothetical protein [Streptomyces cinerochromogenes]|uniref:hypothetical protein n=1 Tax=Streptomyces cinerochromogenes TaxID=66422 RepID=UPI00166F7A10|nr:hypothetical protein [Streptomyces cinerochromogenes]GGT03464.1 hypothetical protein GCM10010206_77580 [Streptomyces cinerochromogenes]
MDAVRVALLREVLAGTEWLGATRRFAGVLRGSVVAHGGGLLLVGTPEYEPWHLAAHLVDEAAWSGTPELAPTLVRHHARPSDPAHLAVGPGRLAAARRGETLLVVAPGEPAPLLERVHDARRAGVTVLALGAGGGELAAMAHDTLAVPQGAELDLDTVQHLVSAAAGENAGSLRVRRGFRDRLSRWTEALTAPPPAPW